MTMRSHVIDYRIHGDGLRFVEVELDPGETGAMIFLESGIGFESMGVRSSPPLLSGRAFSSGIFQIDRVLG